MEVPLACLRWGGAGHDFKSSQCIFWKNVWNVCLDSWNFCMLNGHGSNKTPASSARDLSNCLAFVIWLWQWRRSTLSLLLNILQPWEMMHLSCVSWIESGNLPVLTQELKSSKSSLFEFERCANMINNLITIVLFAKVTAIFTWHI